MMRNLLRIDLDHNRASKSKYWNFSNSTLEVLNLGYNQFNSIPKNLSEFEGLNKLNFRGNRLSSIPEWLNEITELRFVDFSNNRLSTFPKLKKLTNLEGIDLSGNKRV